MSTLENKPSPTMWWYVVYFLLGAVAVIPGLVVYGLWRNKNAKAAGRHLMISFVMAIFVGASMHIATFDKVAPIQSVLSGLGQMGKTEPPQLKEWEKAPPQKEPPQKEPPQKELAEKFEREWLRATGKGGTEPPQKEPPQKKKQGKYGIVFPFGAVPVDLLSPRDLEFKIEALKEELVYLDEELRGFVDSSKSLTSSQERQVRDLHSEVMSLDEDLEYLDEVLWTLMYSNEPLYEYRLNDLRDLEFKVESLRQEVLSFVNS